MQPDISFKKSDPSNSLQNLKCQMTRTCLTQAWIGAVADEGSAEWRKPIQCIYIYIYVLALDSLMTHDLGNSPGHNARNVLHDAYYFCYQGTS